MSEGGPSTGLLLASAALGVMATWTLGFWLHLRTVRRTRVLAKRLVRMVLPMHINRAITHLVRNLTKNPDFHAQLLGKLESTVNLIVAPARGKKTAVRLSVRFDDLGQDSRVRLRMDFSPMIERALRASRMVLFIAWPATVAVIIAALTFLQLAGVNAWTGWSPLNLLHGAYLPMATLLLIHLPFRKRKRVLGDALSKNLESLKNDHKS